MVKAKTTGIPLLLFAHRGEAQALLKHWQLQPRAFAVDGLYASKRIMLCITGEGVQQASERTAAICGAFYREISEVINLGVAGALEPSLPAGAFYEIRTVYRESAGEMVFKTFTTAATTDTAMDCITADRRVLSAEYAAQLRPFAPLVDRELWGIASVCQMFRLPLRSYKLTSDRAGEAACVPVKENAAEWSEALLDQYLAANGKHYIPETAIMDDIALPEGFHVTFSQKRQLLTVIRGLRLKYHLSDAEILGMAKIDELSELAIPAKQRTMLLLQALNQQLNPFNAMLKSRLDELTRPLINAGVRIKFSRDYEDDAVELTASIAHPRHVDRLCKALEAFDYPAVLRLLNGHFDTPVSKKK